MLIGTVFIFDIIPPVGQLNSSVAGLGSPGPSGIILTCNRARCISDLVSQYFFIVCFTSLMHAPT